MAGPSAVVLLADPWTADAAAGFHGWLTGFLDHDEWGWWQPRPSLSGPMLVDHEPFPGDDPYETEALTRAAFLPGTQIVLAAGVNSADDHRFLADLAIMAARRHNGLIDLGAPLPAEALATLPGRWHEIPYETADGEIATSHVVDADLIAAWRDHPRFRMVK